LAAANNLTELHHSGIDEVACSCQILGSYRILQVLKNMKSRLKWWVWQAVIVVGLRFAIPAAAQVDPASEEGDFVPLPYVVPDFGALVVQYGGPQKMEAADVVAVADLMIQIATHPGVDGLTRGKALLIAHNLGNERPVMVTDFELRHGLPLTAFEYPVIGEAPTRMVTGMDPNTRMVPMIESPKFKNADKNGDGQVTREEAGRDWIRFSNYDKDQDSIVTSDEVRTVKTSVTPSEWVAGTVGIKLGPFIEKAGTSAFAPYLKDLHADLTKPAGRTNIQRGPIRTVGNQPPRPSGLGVDWSHAFPETKPGDSGGSQILGQVGDSEPIFFSLPGSGSGGSMTSAVDPGIKGFKRRQSLIKGLLVIQLEGSQFAGGASQMNATLLPGLTGQSTRVTFNQPVGESMESGLVKVLEFVSTLHRDFGDGQRVEISFESQYSSKDGDSASTACALLLDSLVTGADIDPGLAITGALSANGMVEAVGGLDGKIRGATKRNCTHVAIPKANESVLPDLLISDGIGPMAAIQVFTIDTFASAQALAKSPDERSEELAEAMELFKSVQQLLVKQNGKAMLGNVQVQQRLKKVVELAPNHASARYLLLEAIGRAPKALTLQGSITAIDRAALPLIQGLENLNFKQGGSALDSDQFADAMTNLRRIRPRLDRRAWETADAIMDFAAAFKTLKNNPPSSPRARQDLGEKIEETGESVELNYNRLIKLLRAELGIEDPPEPQENR
jgi:hypothetical protein